MGKTKKDHPLSPTNWGNNCWRFLHSSSFAWPDHPTPAQCESATKFYESLGDVLPCPKCRRHYNSHIQQNPPKVRSREELSRWLVDIHNAVNRQNGKEEVDYDTVKRHYLYDSCELNCETQYVKTLEGKLKKTEMCLTAITLSIVFMAIVLLLKRRR